MCRQPVEASAPEFPFCSQRCRGLDLANWLTGAYVIPGPELGEEEESAPSGKREDEEEEQ